MGTLGTLRYFWFLLGTFGYFGYVEVLLGTLGMLRYFWFLLGTFGYFEVHLGTLRYFRVLLGTFGYILSAVHHQFKLGVNAKKRYFLGIFPKWRTPPLFGNPLVENFLGFILHFWP